MLKNVDGHFFVQAIISVFWSFCAAAYIAAVTFLNVPADNMRIVDTILGFLLGTIIGTVMSYWLGSSLGSKLKDKPKEEPNDNPV